MEIHNLTNLSAVIDISSVARNRRANAWTDAASATFPGLAVSAIDANPSIGSIQHRRVGQGALFAIDTAPAEVRYVPEPTLAAQQFLTMMLQVSGKTSAHQHERHCELSRGDLCFIDEHHPFRLVGAECSALLLLRMPRATVLSRFPEMKHIVGTLLPGQDPGTSLLAQTVLNLLSVAHKLHETQQNAAMNGIIHLLGATSGLAAELKDVHWRVQKALDFIELNLATSGLSAEQVAEAQRISRRRLDQLMRDALGLSITGQIWARRLQRAADDLQDPRRAGTAISQIAFANGFEDPAHFARAFKRRFELTPGQWRTRANTVAH